MSRISVQLYSVRAELAKDFKGVIEKIASYGYEGVEFAGAPGGLSFNQCAEIVRKAGLKVSSAHMPLPLGPNKNLIMDNIKLLGCDYIVSGKGQADYKTADMIKKNCDEFNAAAAEAKKSGLKLALHNHWWEFENIDGVPVYKAMLKHLSPDVLFEIDTYWVKVGGKDPVSVLKEIGNRAPLLHIKDGSGVKGDFNMKAAGGGVMDFKPIFQEAKNAEWLICELDACETDMLEAVRESCVYISRNK